MSDIGLVSFDINNLDDVRKVTPIIKRFLGELKNVGYSRSEMMQIVMLCGWTIKNLIDKEGEN